MTNEAEARAPRHYVMVAETGVLFDVTTDENGVQHGKEIGRAQWVSAAAAPEAHFAEVVNASLKPVEEAQPGQASTGAAPDRAPE